MAAQLKVEVKPPPKEMDGVELAQAIRLGTDDEAVAAIEALRTESGTETPAPEEIAYFVEQRIEGKRAFESFAAKFPAIIENEDLMHLALQKDMTLVRGGDKRSYSERYEDIGKSIYTLIGKEIPTGKSDPAVITAAEKLANKDKIVPIKSASARVKSDGEVKPKTASEVIADMRKQRGQA